MQYFFVRRIICTICSTIVGLPKNCFSSHPSLCKLPAKILWNKFFWNHTGIKMSSKYKLTYFDMKGKAEPIRILFAYANVEYEDERITKTDWATLQPQLPWNKIPVLEVDGKQLCESLAIFRYLGRKFGMAGNDDFETAKCDEYVDAIVDVRTEAVKMMTAETDAKKAELKIKAETELFPNMFRKFNEILKKNGNGVLVGKGVTYADIFLAFYADYIRPFLDIKNWDEFPLVVEHRDKIIGSPGVKAWFEKRPVNAH